MPTTYFKWNPWSSKKLYRRHLYSTIRHVHQSISWGRIYKGWSDTKRSKENPHARFRKTTLPSNKVFGVDPALRPRSETKACRQRTSAGQQL